MDKITDQREGDIVLNTLQGQFNGFAAVVNAVLHILSYKINWMCLNLIKKKAKRSKK